MRSWSWTMPVPGFAMSARVDVRAMIEPGERHSDGKAEQHRKRLGAASVASREFGMDSAGGCRRRGSVARRFRPGRTDRGCDAGIDPAQQFPFVEAERRAWYDCRVQASMPASGEPTRPRADPGRQPRSLSTGSSKANRPAWCASSCRTVIASLPLLGELRPVRRRRARRSRAIHGNARPRASSQPGPFVADQTTTMVSSSHGSRVNPVSHTAPEIDDLLAALVHTAGAAQLMAPSEVLGERVAHALESRAHVSFDVTASPGGRGHYRALFVSSLGRRCHTTSRVATSPCRRR